MMLRNRVAHPPNDVPGRLFNDKNGVGVSLTDQYVVMPETRYPAFQTNSKAGPEWNWCEIHPAALFDPQ